MFLRQIKLSLRLLLAGVLFTILIFAPAVMAETPDGQTPAEESVCDGFGLTGKAWGLCNAYCEAMDCDDANPQASEQACQRVLASMRRDRVRVGALHLTRVKDNDSIIETPGFAAGRFNIRKVGKQCLKSLISMV